MAWAQIPTHELHMKGVITDSITHAPLELATIILIDAGNAKSLKSTLSKNDGSFSFHSLKRQSYKLKVSTIGYESKTVAVPETQQGIIDLGHVMLKPSPMGLNEVSVTAAKPIVKQEVDRIAYDVQADPESKSFTVLDMLRKVPLISVDASDNIKLKGNTNYKILINGRPSAMLAKDPAEVFKSMPAENIQKIEVITTPPAKYDAEGLAGIINIITKKKVDEGYNGQIGMSYNSVNGPGTNINGTLKQGKLGIAGYAGLSQQRSPQTAYGYSNETLPPRASLLLQDGTRKGGGNNRYANAELSFEIDTLNLLTGTIEHYSGRNERDGDLLSLRYDSNSSLIERFRQLTARDNDYNGTSAALNYQLGFRADKDRLLTASYKFDHSGNEQRSDVAFLEQSDFLKPDFRQFNRSGTDEHTMQLDYIHPIKAFTMETGIKAILRSSYSNFITANRVLDDYVPQDDLSNNFDYKQRVYAGYNSWTWKADKWVIKAGLRFEHTDIEGDFFPAAAVLDIDYNNLLPSVSAQREINKSNSLTFGYSERMERPNIWTLNPFVDRTNPNFVFVGNPDLEPVINRSLELNYSNFKKGSVNVGLSYSFADNTAEEVSSIGADTITVTTFQNVGRNRRLGLSLNVNYPITSKFNINANSQIQHVWLRGTYDGNFYDRTGFQGHLYFDASYKFEKSYTVAVDFGFDSRYVMLQGTDNVYVSSSASLTKMLFNDKLSLSGFISNPFKKYRRNDFFTNTPEFRQSNYSDINFRRIHVRVAYKFGNQKSAVKRNQRGINNDDLSGGRGR